MGKCGRIANTCSGGDFHPHPHDTATLHRWSCRNRPHNGQMPCEKPRSEDDNNPKLGRCSRTPNHCDGGELYTPTNDNAITQAQRKIPPQSQFGERLDGRRPKAMGLPQYPGPITTTRPTAGGGIQERSSVRPIWPMEATNKMGLTLHPFLGIRSLFSGEGDWPTKTSAAGQRPPRSQNFQLEKGESVSITLRKMIGKILFTMVATNGRFRATLGSSFLSMGKFMWPPTNICAPIQILLWGDEGDKYAKH